MSRPINISDTLTFIPTSNVSTTNMSASSSYPASNGYTDASSTTYTRFSITTNTTGSTYYVFSVSGIPSNATISSVSCVARIYVNNTSRVTNTQIQLYSGTTAKGTSGTFASNSNTNTVTLNGGTWTVAELENARLYFKGTASNNSQNKYIYFYGATLTINYSLSGTEYEITSTLATDKVDSISPEGQTWVVEGNSYELEIYGDSLEDVSVTDNDMDVTDFLVQHENESGDTTISKTADSFTTGFSGGSNMNFYTSSSSTGNNFNYAVGHTAESPGSTSSGSGSWTYVKENGSSTNYTGYADFVFDFSDIPANAIIKSVQVKCYGAVESASESTSHSDITLFSGSTQKGTMQKFTSSSNSVITISNPGTWTRAELQSAKLRFAVGYYGGHIFGITWTVTYSIPVTNPYYWTYSLSNVQADHVIIVGESYTGPFNEINVRIYASDTDTNTKHKLVKPGDNFTLEIYRSSLSHITVKDNGTNVTSSITGANPTFYYALSNISINHSIEIVEDTWYEITCESTCADASVVVSSNKVYENGNFTVTVNVSNISLVKVKDNGVDISLQRISSGVYRATISNVNEDHEIVVIEANSWTVTSMSNTPNATIDPSGVNSILDGNSQTFSIYTNLALENIIVKDNGNDVTSQLEYVSSAGSSQHYEYTIAAITADHTINVFEVFVPEEEDENKTYYSVTISAINATTTPSIGTIRVEEGEDITITVSPSEQQVTLVTDNGRDISGYLNFNEPTYTVTTQVSGASYGFNLNQSTGYYVSTNNGVSKSASVARLNLSLPVRCLVTIEYINYAEANYDYGMFGKIDTSVATDGLTASSGSSSPSDSTNNYQLAMASNSQSTQTITYTVESGDHFIDIKYGKDDGTNSNNDSLQWKVSNIQPLESLDNTYTIHSIDEDHNLTFVFGEVIYYTVESSGTNSRLFPNGEFVVLPNDLYSLVIIPNASNYKPTVHDNGRNVTGSLAEIEKGDTFYYQYTIKKTTANHVIIVECEQVSGLIFVKSNGTYVSVSKVFVKSNGSWVEQDDYTNIFEQGKLYVNAT